MIGTLSLSNNPEESFNSVILGVRYNFRQIRNTLGHWSLDILDENNSPLVLGVKIVTKTNLLSQYANIPFDLRSESNDDPTRENLDSFNLIVTDKDA